MKMCLRLIVLFCLLDILVWTYGKELESNGLFPSSSIRLLRRVKRKNSYDGYDEPNRSDSESRRGEQHENGLCSPSKSSPQTNMIIRSSTSIENGAKYISALKQVSSSRECYNMCCQNPDCDTSIYEDKDDRRCYLFDCHGECKFKQHNNYTVWNLERRENPPPKEEEELAHLPTDDINDNDDDNDDDDVSDDSSQRASPESDVREEDDHRSGNSNHANSEALSQNTKKPYVPPHTAELSAYCSSDASCEDPNAACFREACHCKEGYYNKDGLCRKVCLQPEFECLGLGTLGRGPECIPKSQVCDSYMQCADGSDEFNCDTQASNVGPGAGSWHSASSSSSSAWMGGQNSNDKNNAMDTKQRVEGTQAVVHQEGPQAVVHQEGPQRPTTYGSPKQAGSTPSDAMNNAHGESMTNPRSQQRGDTNTGNYLNTAPSVRPNPVLPLPDKAAGMDTRKPMIAHDNHLPAANPARNANNNNNNPNNVYSQPTNNVNNSPNVRDRGMPNNQNYNQNTGNNRASHLDNSAAPVMNKQNAKPPQINSFPRRPNGPRQPMKSQPAQNYKPSMAKEPPQRQKPSNMAYSESGPFREMPGSNGNGRNQQKNPMVNQGGRSPQRQQSPPSKPLLSNLAPQASRNSKASQHRDRLVGPSNPDQRLKNPMPSLPKPSPSSPLQHATKSQNRKGDSYKNQPKSRVSGKTKASSSNVSPAARPSYPDSSLLSPSSSSSSSSSLSSSTSLHRPGGQSWLDSNPYLAYGSQRQKPQQPSRSSQYYDPSQYFPQYSSDSLDSLSPSLLGETGSQDDFSQFGGSYTDRQKPLNRMPYPVNNGNFGYGGYPDSSYNSQYNPSNRYNYGMEYGTNSYQDPDFYPPSPQRNSNPKGYPPTGLFEDVQSNSHGPSSSSNPKVDDSNGAYQPGNKVNPAKEGKDDADTDKISSATSLKGKGDHSEADASTSEAKENTSSKESTDAAAALKNKTKVEGGDSDSSSLAKTNPTTNPTTKKPHSSLSHSKVFVTREKVAIIASSITEAEGPIIALSLGLAFTLVLIVLLACRLRNMKHRLRKGRPLNSNEADYLINGMYL